MPYSRAHRSGVAGVGGLAVALWSDDEVVVPGVGSHAQPVLGAVRVAELDVNLTPVQPVDITLCE